MDGRLTSDDEEKAELLNYYFTSMFIHEKLENIPNLESKIENPPPVEVVFSTEVVEKKLKKLKTIKSAGPDGFHPRVLHELAQSIKVPLSIFLPSHMKRGVYRWLERRPTQHQSIRRVKKVATGKYRPVSLTSVIGKIMESIIRDRLVKYMINHSLFCDSQHAFVPDPS